MADAPIDAVTTDAGDRPTLPVQHRRHGRPRALAVDRFFPAHPRDPASDRGRAVGHRRLRSSPSSSGSRSSSKAGAPESLQRFVASYVRYSVQVSGYLHIAAAPWPRFGGSDGYPIDVELDVAPAAVAAAVLPRLFLALPAFLLAAAIGGGVWFGDASWTGSNDSAAAWSVGASAGGLAATAAFLAWFASVGQGTHAARPPRPRRVRNRVHGAGRARTCSSITDVYPSTDPNRVLPMASLPPHPVRLRLTDGLERSRLTVFFRLLLALPHIIWLLLWTVVALLALDRRLGRRARDRARASGPPPLSRGLGPVRDARRRLPLPRRRAVPGLRRRRRELPRRPRDRSARAAATRRDALPLLPRDPGALPRLGVHGRPLRGGVPRLVGGTVHRPHAGGDPEPRRRGPPLLGSGERVPLPPHRSLPVLGARAAGPVARRAARARPVAPVRGGPEPQLPGAEPA